MSKRRKESAAARTVAARADSPRSGRWTAFLIAIAVAGIAFSVFSPALHAGFVNYDDTDNFVRNPAFRGLEAQNLHWMFTTALAGHYAPVAWISHALDFLASGLDPEAFHRTNLLLHAANAALVCALAWRLLAIALPREARAHPAGHRLAGALAALLFAVHPLRAESVGWITERRGLLCTAFLLLATLAYLRACPPGGSRIASRGAYVASIVLLALAVLSKGIAMTFVGVLVVLDFHPLRRLPPRLRDAWSPAARGVWIQKIPFLAIGLASAFLSNWAANFIPGTSKSLAEWGLPSRIAQAFFGLAFYVEKTVVPTGLAAVVETPYRFDPAETRFVASAIAVVLAAAVVVLLRKRAPGLAAAAVVYTLVLAPVLGLTQAGPQLVADRYSYLACLSFAIALGAGLLLLLDRGPAIAAKLAFLAAAAAAVVLAVLSIAQIEVWHDSRRLWEHALEVGRPSSVAHVNLGGLDAEAGDDEGAIAHFLAATELRPDQDLAWFNLGILYAREDRIEEAERADLEAIRTSKPAFRALVNLGNLYRQKMGRLDDAIALYRRAVAETDLGGPRPASSVPHLVLGSALLQKGEVEEARRWLEFAARFLETRDEALSEMRR